MQDETTPRIRPLGDAALSVEFGEGVDRALSARALALDAALRAAPPPGLLETAPSFRALLIEFDPRATTAEAMAAAARAALAACSEDAAAGAGGRLWRLPACYEGDCAPDLAEVAAETGVAAAEIAARHQAMRHHVYMIGFLPGCPYMGDLPPELTLPRRADPRLRVPAGSVAIAAGLTVIYPVESPGGWRLIGRTPTRMFDPARPQPALLAPGDVVTFEPIGAARCAELEAAAAEGAWAPTPEPLAEAGA
ncbi:MAG: 5-oxoprolinase subunit PxpB [Pseudomonadota bacterium]